MKWVGGLALGFALSVISVGMLAGVVSFGWVKSAESKARRGWNLVPVVVFAVDVPAGKEVTFDQVSQRSVPEQLATSSVVKPDSVSYVMNQRLLVPGLAGQSVLWSMFELLPAGPKAPPREAIEACMARLPYQGEGSIDAVRARLGAKP